MADNKKLISVIGSQYCVPKSVNLHIDSVKGVIYLNGNKVLCIKDPLFSLHDRRVLCDVQGNPILTLYFRTMTLHNRCQVFKGKSNDESELLFTTKRSSMIQGPNIKLDVFLASNIDESVCDFKVKADSKESLCYTIHPGESSKVLAEMSNIHVLVHPNVDYAFIVALLLIVANLEDYSAASMTTAKTATKTAYNIGSFMSS